MVPTADQPPARHARRSPSASRARSPSTPRSNRSGWRSRAEPGLDRRWPGRRRADEHRRSAPTAWPGAIGVGARLGGVLLPPEEDVTYRASRRPRFADCPRPGRGFNRNRQGPRSCRDLRQAASSSWPAAARRSRRRRQHLAFPAAEDGAAATAAGMRHQPRHRLAGLGDHDLLAAGRAGRPASTSGPELSDLRRASRIWAPAPSHLPRAVLHEAPARCVPVLRLAQSRSARAQA